MTTEGRTGLEGGVKLSDLISKYDGTGDVTEWLDQLQIAKEPAKITDLTQVLPAFLRGDAFKVYKNLPEEEKRDFKAIADALTTAFGVDKHVAFCELVSRKWKDGESVDVYIAELKRLASLAGSPERTVRMVLMNGLPEKVGLQLKTTPNVKEMELKQVVALARRLMAATNGPLDPGPLPGPVISVTNKRTGQWEVGAAAMQNRQLKCFFCSEEGHIIRFCPKKAQRRNQKEPSMTGSENENELS